MSKRKTRFEKMWEDMPPCITGSTADDARDEEELIHCVRTSLDLCEEGQDGTEDDDPDAIRKWLKKWDK